MPEVPEVPDFFLTIDQKHQIVKTLYSAMSKIYQVGARAEYLAMYGKTTRTFEYKMRDKKFALQECDYLLSILMGSSLEVTTRQTFGILVGQTPESYGYVVEKDPQPPKIAKDVELSVQMVVESIAPAPVDMSHSASPRHPDKVRTFNPKEPHCRNSDTDEPLPVYCGYQVQHRGTAKALVDMQAVKAASVI